MADAEQWLIGIIKKIADEKNCRNHEIEVKPFTTGGANYSSVIFYVTITEKGKDDLNLFAKVAVIGEDFRKKINLDKLFNAEQLFYNRLVNIWKELQLKYDVPAEHEFPFPKFYAGSAQRGRETVVLENLTKQGYGLYNRFESVDWEYATSSIEVLAKFHALSFVFERDLPEEYAKVSKEIEFEFSGDNATMVQTWNNVAMNALTVLNEENKEKVRKFIGESNFVEMHIKYNKPRGRSVIIHGDYRPSNILSRKEGNTYKIIPVDYQTLHGGCPVTDLIYFVALGTDEKFRAQYFDQLVEHYYHQLTLALKRFQIEIHEVYPREEFDEDLKETLPYFLSLGLMVLQIVLVEAKDAPKLDGDVDSYDVKINDLYVERFNGVVNDCIRWGIL